jgi:hypothetical protein
MAASQKLMGRSVPWSRRWRKMEAAIGANHQNVGSGHSIFNFYFSA